MFVGLVQYGQRSYLCETLIGRNTTFQEKFDNMLNYARLADSPFDYGAYYLKNDTYTDTNDGSR